jgi:hypothetical protein
MRVALFLFAGLISNEGQVLWIGGAVFVCVCTHIFTLLLKRSTVYKKIAI